MLDKDGVIVAGHGRFIAMTELLGYTLMEQKAFTKKGEPVIPYVMVDDLSEEEIKAYRIADNQLNAITGQDMMLITDELKYLDAAGFDITLTGFDRDIIIEDDEKDDILPEDAGPAEKQSWRRVSARSAHYRLRRLNRRRCVAKGDAGK